MSVLLPSQECKHQLIPRVNTRNELAQSVHMKTKLLCNSARERPTYLNGGRLKQIQTKRCLFM